MRSALLSTLRWLVPGLLGPLCAACHPAIGTRAEATLVQSVPVETTLARLGLADTAPVWLAMIERARRTIDLGTYYVSEAEGPHLALSRLAPILRALERAVARGVRVRLLTDAQMASKYPDPLLRLEQAGVQVRRYDVAARMGGVQHAKYLISDETESFVGSQNFDWRALDHIHELGLHLRSAALTRELLDVFDTDWELAGGAASDRRVRRGQSASADEATGGRLTLLVSPRGWLPDEASWDLPRLVALLDGAARSVDVQILSYSTEAGKGGGERFMALDEALRRAAARGVRVRLLVSDWSTRPASPALASLQALAALPNVTIRVLVVPPWSGGRLPFARVAHAKYLVLDGASAWIGTSNWDVRYFFSSRNVGFRIDGGALPRRLAEVFEGAFSSRYALPLPARAPD